MKKKMLTRYGEKNNANNEEEQGEIHPVETYVCQCLPFLDLPLVKSACLKLQAIQSLVVSGLTCLPCFALPAFHQRGAQVWFI